MVATRSSSRSMKVRSDTPCRCRNRIPQLPDEIWRVILCMRAMAMVEDEKCRLNLKIRELRCAMLRHAMLREVRFVGSQFFRYKIIYSDLIFQEVLSENGGGGRPDSLEDRIDELDDGCIFEAWPMGAAVVLGCRVCDVNRRELRTLSHSIEWSRSIGKPLYGLFTQTFAR
eukprot:1130862-Prymnesium_polylepis.1